MSIEIKVQRVGKGDCIWLKYGKENKVNIIIDSGTATKAKEFRNIIKSISESNEVIDLLILTHIDNDHINGFKKYISKNDGKIIKEVWFHGKGVKAYAINAPHSPKSAIQLEGIMEQRKMNVNHNIFKGYKKTINEAELCILTPTREAVRRVGTIVDQYVSPHGGGVHNQDLDWIYKNDEYIRDNSDTNAASISFVFSYEGKNIAFLGDAHAEDIIDSKNDFYNGINMDLVKLPHHGSSHNITEDLMKCLLCNNFIISTNQPVDKNTIARVVNSVEKSTIYCNYSWWDCNGYYTKKDREEYVYKEKLIMKELKKDEIIFSDEGCNIWELKKN
ncbi:MBL fold metallo-hydrolase [Clostridium estertheticum]|uniref:MBL fold metallo-hydrolase n=1 Tax=Clostridium estertheticum TaxID=238834 RepID=UPI001C0C50ED|nr:MBL fold metallo-hydrolase [Clostridium estertheticum]MBU3175378.1 MBL fold metallo-hydrolase [Clostridium estertheticum]